MGCAARFHQDALDHSDWVSGSFKPFQIKGHCQKCACPGKDDVPCGRVPGVGASIEQHFHLSRLQGKHTDAGLIETAACVYGEENRLASRQKLGPAVAVFSLCRVGCGQNLSFQRMVRSVGKGVRWRRVADG